MAKTELPASNYSDDFFKFADETEEVRYYYEDTEHYIALKADISKRTATALLKFAPRKEDDLDGGMRFIEAAFKHTVVGWSFSEPPTVESYLKLSAKPASWIDRKLGEHLRTLLGTDAEEVEGKPEE